MLYGFTIRDFRNFDSEEQWISPLSRVNVFIGANNSGKSNVLRYIKRIVAPGLEPSRSKAVEQPPVDVPVAGGRLDNLSYWTPFQPDKLVSKDWRPNWTEALKSVGILDDSETFARLRISLSAIDRDRRFVGQTPQADQAVQQAFYQIWHSLTHSTGGGFAEHWFPGVMNRIIQQSLTNVQPFYVPSFRQIPSRMAAFQDEFAPAPDAGEDHIIEKLAALAYPSYTEQSRKHEFEKLRKFVGSIIGDENVQIEIPNDRKTINVKTGQGFLPIEALGSGVHEVFMLASEIVVRPTHTILLEEPEVHLHPTLQRRFMQFVMEETSNQIFLTTHSATIIDTPGAQIFEVRNDGNAAVKSLGSTQERFAACREIGFRASDLLQTNSILWVEGPSDRIYLLNWIKEIAPDLQEGLHFSIMFYGGKLLSRLSLDEEAVEDFIKLLPICRSPVMLIDSDKSGGQSKIRETKLRILTEFEAIGAFCWITEGREIENFYSFEDRLAAVRAAHSDVQQLVGGRTRYDKPITFVRSGSTKETTADKIAVANYLTEHAKPSVERESFDERMAGLVKCVRAANA